MGVFTILSLAMLLNGPRLWAGEPLQQASAASAETVAAAIRGRVLDGNGNPAAGAIVQLTDSGGVTVYEAATSAEGRFLMPGVRPGSYQLVAIVEKRVSPPVSIEHSGRRATEATLKVEGSADSGRASPAPGTQAAREGGMEALRAQLAALQHQVQTLAAAPNGSSKGDGQVRTTEDPADEPMVASAAPAETLASALAGPRPEPQFQAAGSPAPQQPPQQPASQQPASQQPPQLEEERPGRAYTNKGLYQGLAAGAPGSRYGRGLFFENLRVGGYGSFRFEANNIDQGPAIGDLPRLQRSHNSFDFRRFVLTVDASPFKRLRFYTEIEFERLSEIEVERNAIPENRGRIGRDRRGTRFIQEVEGTNASELAMEQAWAQFDFSDNVGARFGVILPPVGRFNILHDDDFWDLPRRTLVDRGGPVLPSKAAWSELGAGLIFNKPLGDGYIDGQFYVVNGVQLDFSIEEVAAFREGRELLELEPEIFFSSGAFDGSQTSDAFTWRLAFSPSLGQEIAVSGYHGEYTPDYLVADGWINTLAVDGKATLGNFEMEGEYVYTDFGSFREVLNDIGLQLVDAAAITTGEENEFLESELETGLAGPFTQSRQGFWIDFKYRARPDWLRDGFLGSDFEDPQLIPIVRYERIWFDDFLKGMEFSDSQVLSTETEDLEQDRLSVGMAYRPTASVVFSAAWEHNERRSGSQLIFPQPTGVDPLPDSSFDSFIFGTAFGF